MEKNSNASGLRPRGLALALALAALCAGVAPGCRTRGDAIDQPIALMPPVSYGGGLLFVDATHARGYFLDLAAASATVRALDVGTAPVVLTPRAAHAEALLLSRGTRGDTGVRPEPGTLTALPADANAAVRTYTVNSPFNGLAQTADGRRAFVYFRPETAQGRLLYNPNEVAIVDLDAPPSATNPVARTVRSFGGVPNNVVFSPTLRIHGEDRVLAVVLSDAYVTLMDLAHTDRPEITARLTLPEDPRAILPTQLVFDTDNASVYVRAASSNDIYVLQLNELATPAAGANDFTVTINQLAAGQRPADMALFGDGTARRLLVVSPGSQDARVVDARSNTVTVVPLDAPAESILLYNGASPRDPVAAPRALLYAANGYTRAVSFLDLADVEERRGRNVEALQLARSVIAALPLPERSAVMLQHGTDGGGSNTLSLLDLERRTAAPIFAEVSLLGAEFDADRRTLWVAPTGVTRLGYIDLTSFHPGEVRLDNAVVATLPINGDPMGRNRVAAIHGGSEGFLTVLDSSNPSREGAASYRGFVLTDLLDRGEP